MGPARCGGNTGCGCFSTPPPHPSSTLLPTGGSGGGCAQQGQRDPVLTGAGVQHAPACQCRLAAPPPLCPLGHGSPPRSPHAWPQRAGGEESGAPSASLVPWTPLFEDVPHPGWLSLSPADPSCPSSLGAATRRPSGPCARGCPWCWRVLSTAVAVAAEGSHATCTAPILPGTTRMCPCSPRVCPAVLQPRTRCAQQHPRATPCRAVLSACPPPAPGQDPAL